MHRTLKHTVAAITMGLFCLSAAPTLAQDGDGFDRLRGLGGGGGGDGGNQQQPRIPDNLPPLVAPDWVQPGVVITFRGGASTEGAPPNPNRQPGDPVDHGSAALGYTIHEVVARTDTFIILSTLATMQEGVNDSRQLFAGGGISIITSNEIMGGATFFTDPGGLRQLEDGNGITVQRGPYNFNGQNIQAAMVTVRGNDFVNESVYDAETGIRLTNRAASGPLRRGETQNEFNRRSKEHSEFVGIRRLEGPWRQAGWPDWANQVRRVRYEGRMTYSAPDFEYHMPMSVNVTIDQRGSNWVRGTSEVTMRVEGQPEQKQQSPFAAATGTLSGYWLSPDLLRAMQSGIIDRDGPSGTIIRYERTGSHGVFTTETTGGSRLIARYRLQDGALESSRYELSHLGQTVELRLAGME